MTVTATAMIADLVTPDTAGVALSLIERFEIAVDDKLVEGVCDAIKSSAESGKIGDGKIFVLNLESATRIRTGETGASAL